MPASCRASGALRASRRWPGEGGAPGARGLGLLFGLALCLSLGCAEEQVVTLADYLGELEFEAPLEEVSFVPLGHYRIPIVAEIPQGRAGEKTSLWMQLQFEMVAETAPEDEAAVVSALERHRGTLQDRVLTICRTTSVDELGDPRLAAVRSRLGDSARSLLGETRIRALILNGITTDFL